MSIEINNGGPAFPYEDTGNYHTHEGMTLRDYFAAQVMPEIYRRSNICDFNQVAAKSYALADDMLRERSGMFKSDVWKRRLATGESLIKIRHVLCSNQFSWNVPEALAAVDAIIKQLQAGAL